MSYSRTDMVLYLETVLLAFISANFNTTMHQNATLVSQPHMANAQQGPENTILHVVFFPLVSAIIGIRIYTRLRLSKSFGADDWLIIASLFPTTAISIISLLTQLRFGWNRHTWDVSENHLILGYKMLIATEVLFAAATTLTKCSMLVLIYRVVASGTGLGTFSKVIIAAICVVAAQGTAFCIGIVALCKKPHQHWHQSFEHQPICLSKSQNIILAAGIINTVTDLLVVVLPLPTVWRLKLPVQQQIILVLLFGSGFLVTFAGVVRTIFLYRVSTEADKTWAAFPAWITCSLELYIGLICASLPATKKFFSLYGPKCLGLSMLTRSKIDSPTASRITQSIHRDRVLEEYGIDTLPPLYTTNKNEDRSGIHVIRSYSVTSSRRPHSGISSFDIADEEGHMFPDSRSISYGSIGIYDDRSGVGSTEELVVSTFSHQNKENDRRG